MRVSEVTLSRMKLYLCSFSIIVLHELVGCTTKPWRKTSLRSVTSFSGLKKLYQDTKSEKEPLKINHDTDIITKRNICDYVLTSSHFKIMEEQLVDLQLEEARKELYAHHRNIYNDFYTSKKKRKRDSFFKKGGRRVYHYKNPYKEREVLLDEEETFFERVFTCLAREGENVKEYFISQEYNVNKTSSPEYVTGRFVFSSNASKKLAVVALAEEAALLHTAYNSPEFLYIARRRRLRLHESEQQNNPVCTMSAEDKLRTCSAILSVPELNNFKFAPTMNSVEPECVEKELAFRSEHIERQLDSSGTVYTEWTIACKAERIKDKSEEKFYISRSYHVNKVFVYRPATEERITIEFIGSSIAVVHDLVELL